MSQQNIKQEYNNDMYMVYIKSELGEDSAAQHDNVRVKQEPCDHRTDENIRKMYADHEVKAEIVVGPEELQKPAPSAKRVKQEPQDRVRQGEIKDKQPYAERSVKVDCVLGPMVLQKSVPSVTRGLEESLSVQEGPVPRRRRRKIRDPLSGISSGDTPPTRTSPQLKRKKSILSIGERYMIINIFKYVERTWPKNIYPSNTEMVRATSEISNVCTRSIYRILGEYRDTHTVTEPAKTRNRQSILDKIDDFDKSAIRKVIHSFYLKGELPTLDKISQAVNDDENLPVLSRTSLRGLIKELKFRYIQTRGRRILIDQPTTVLWRIKYLKEIKNFREEDHRIFYTDVTWVNAEGSTTGAKDAAAKGKRLIAVHVGNEDGFVDGCEWVFESNKTKDHHEHVDAPHFEHWFGKVLDKLQPNDVIVMDNANSSYHSRRVEKKPTMAWKKENIQDWLLSKNISFETIELKAQLIEKVKKYKGDVKPYVIDEMAKEKSMKVLRLPPYHCELNPFKLVWTDVKSYVNRNCIKGNMKNSLFNAMAHVTTEKWKSYVELIKQEEIRMSALDQEIDRTVDRFIVNGADSDSTDSISESEESEAENE